MRLDYIPTRQDKLQCSGNRENIRAQKSDELEKRESTVSPTHSLTSLDEAFVDKSQTASEANAEVLGALKPAATTTIPNISGNCVASIILTCAYAESATPIT